MRAKRRFMITAYLVIIAAFLVLFEYTARKLYEPTRNLFARMDPEFNRLGLHLLEEDSRRIWRLAPGVEMEHPVSRKVMRTNAKGFRGAEPAEVRGVGGLRVVFLGGSLFFGTGIGDGETVPARTAEALAELLPGRKVEVLNLAVPGYSSFQVRRLAEEVLPSLRPDLVVVGLGYPDSLLANYTDAEVAEALHEQGSFFAFLDPLLGGSRLFQLVRNRFRAPKGRKMLAPTKLVGDKAVRVTARVPPGRFHSNVEAILRAVRAAGAVPLLADTNLVNYYAADTLKEVARARGIPWLSVRELLEAATRREAYTLVDTHRLKRVFAIQVRGIPDQGGEPPENPFLLEIPLGGVRHPPFPERLMLRDDGTYLDRAPGDGIYTARLVDRGDRSFEFTPAMKILIAQTGAYEQFVETAVFHRLPPCNDLQEKGLYYSPVFDFDASPFEDLVLPFNHTLVNERGARRVASVLAERAASLLEHAGGGRDEAKRPR